METTNKAKIAESIAKEIFEYFFWKVCGPTNNDFPWIIYFLLSIINRLKRPYLGSFFYISCIVCDYYKYKWLDFYLVVGIITTN
ncbi:hypothetical protein [Actinobacillus lignieresii]|uniref:hypothetical protein n=1 Tax=Actinobacillus lignieresii TaxID=720 RepID=UPI000E20AFE9|nr:hypothetical protein [Actinobacillus lignieresii]